MIELVWGYICGAGCGIMMGWSIRECMYKIWGD